jgi:uncharacterized metal-binding protein
MSDRPPLVYSCSGCSSAAQMANHLAIRLDRDNQAEMSCIAGVGGGVPGLVKTAHIRANPYVEVPCLRPIAYRPIA